MMAKLKKINFISSILFFASPFLSIPFLIKLLFQKSKLALYLITIFLGLLGSLYIPHVNNDKAAYFLKYVNFKNVDLSQFINIFSVTPNIAFDFLLATFSIMGFSFDFFYFVITSIIVGIYFYCFNKIVNVNKCSGKRYFIYFLLLLLSISLVNLFSVTKFYLGSAFLLLSFYKGFFDKKTKQSLLFLAIAIFVHFSLISFIPVFILLKFLPHKNKLYFTVFLLSLVFIFLPKELLYDLTQLFSFSEGYSSKIDVYLLEDDFVASGIAKGSSASLIIHLSSILWYFIACFYLIITYKRKSTLRSLCYLSLTISNVFYSTPFIFSRFLIFSVMIFTLLIIFESLKNRSLKTSYIFIFLFSLNWITDIIVLRYNLIESFVKLESLTLLTMILNESMKHSDFIN